MLLILAVSESEPLELPGFSSAAALDLSHRHSQPRVGAVHHPRAWGLTAVASSKEGQAHRQHRPAEPPRAKPQALLRAKLSPFKLHTHPEVAEDR